MKKKYLLLTILFIAIGFAAISTTLFLNGTIKIGVNADFADEVIFTSANAKTPAGKEVGGNASISADGKTVEFITGNLDSINKIASLEFEIKNNSTQYNAEASISCTSSDENYEDYLNVSTGKESYTIKAGESVTDLLEIKLIKTALGENGNGKDVSFKCEINANAIEKSDVGTLANTPVCKRATTLHTEICNNDVEEYYYGLNHHCFADGYAIGDTITYGNLGKNETLIVGDAFDCDVNGDGIYDSSTERFYYVDDLNSDTVSMIYYNNTDDGIPNNSITSAYDSEHDGYDFYGPRTAVKELPTTSQWKNVSLTNTSRNILNDLGEIKVPNFSYNGYAARLLTYQEVANACYDGVISADSNEILPSKCQFLFENSKYSSSTNTVSGLWLEDYHSLYGYNYDILILNNHERKIAYSISVTINSAYSVRPVIEVPKTAIEY